LRILIGVRDAPVLPLLPRVARISTAVRSQLARGGDGLAELPDHLLCRLRRQVRVPALHPALPSGFRGPRPVQATDAEVSFDQIAPETGGLQARRRKRRPSTSRARQPGHFYRAIAHTTTIAWRHSPGRLKTTTL